MLNGILTWLAWFAIVIAGIATWENAFEYKRGKYSESVNRKVAYTVLTFYVLAIYWVTR